MSTSASSYAPIPVDIRCPSSTTLQNAIQSGLAARGYATEDDPVMAEYILVMLANAKTRQQIDAELSDLIGSDYSDEFTAWLWGEADRILNGGGGGQEAGPSSAAPAEALAGAEADASMDVADGDARPSPPSDARRSSRSPEMQRRRSQSPPQRIRRNDRHDGGYGRQGGSGDRQDRYGAPRRPPRELFDSAVSSAGRRQDFGRGRGDGASRYGEEGGPYRSRLAMDDEQLSAPAPHREFRIRGSAPTNAAGPSPPTGPRELFARSMNAAAAGSSGPTQPPRGPRQRDGAAASGPGASISLLARAGVPDPRAAAFVPTGPAAMRLAPAAPMAGGAGSIFSRIDPMLPNNAPPPSAATASTSSFPTQPTQTSLCRYSLGCTNPLCLYSHPSPSAAMRRKAAASIGRAMTASKDDPVLTSDRPCRFGIECTNVECGFSHVSPAVLFVTLKNRTAGGGSGSAAGAGGGAAMVVDTTSTPCRFANECSNPSCGYAHFDEQGKPAPSPALTKLLRPGAAGAGAAAATTGNDSVAQDDSELEINTEMADGEATPGAAIDVDGMTAQRGADGKPLALDRALDDGTTSSNGAAAANGKKLCKFGSGCLRADCWFSHPEWRATPSMQTEEQGQEAGGGAGGGGKMHISDRLSRFNRETDGDGEGGEMERIIPVA